MKLTVSIACSMMLSCSCSSIWGAEDGGDLRPIRGIIAEPFWATPLPYILLGILLVIALGIWLGKRTLWKKVPPPLPSAYELAIAQLEQARTLMLEKQDKAFSSVVSDAIRQYIEKRFEINAPEQTTEEFLAAAGRHPLLKGEALDQLSQFLELCDVVKFAQQSFGTLQREAQYSSAEQFLNESEKNLDAQRALNVKP